MKLFLSYASEHQLVADEIALALSGAGHEVVFDTSWLKPGDDYNGRLRDAFDRTDGLVFLISPESVRAGRYALSELKFAREKWPHPAGHVLPVMVKSTPLEDIPPYLRAVSILKPEGNVAAEVASAVRDWETRLIERRHEDVRVTVHIAAFQTQPTMPAAFVNITNLFETREIVITHVWFETVPHAFLTRSDRRLPVRLKPFDTWETWMALSSLPAADRDKLFGMARVRLSSGQILSSAENADVPDEGFVPGGPITSLGNE